jgi:hypothetical protein
VFYRFKDYVFQSLLNAFKDFVLGNLLFVFRFRSGLCPCRGIRC